MSGINLQKPKGNLGDEKFFQTQGGSIDNNKSKREGTLDNKKSLKLRGGALVTKNLPNTRGSLE